MNKNNLIIIDNNVSEFIPIYETDKGEKVVSGNELYEGLGVSLKTQVSDWIRSQLEKVDATEKDFFVLKRESTGGRPSIDYILKLEIAKEICLVAGTSPRANEQLKKKSKEYRKYLIQFEEKYKNNLPKISDEDRAILNIVNAKDKVETATAIKEYKDIITKPLITTIDEQNVVIGAAINDDGLYDIGVIGKLLKPYCSNMGQNKIFEYLRDNKILINKNGTQKHNNPYDRYKNYFEMKLKTIDRGYFHKSYIKTYFNGKGLKWFLKRLAKEGHIQKKDIEKINEDLSDLD